VREARPDRRPGRLPRFVKQYGDMRADLLTAAGQYVRDVAVGSYPDQAHSYQ